MKKISVGLACIKFDPSFWGFRESQYKARVARLAALGGKMGFTLTAIPTAFQTAEEAQSAAKRLNDKSDLVILDVGAYPEGKAAGVFFDNVTKPLALWSRGESAHRTNIAHNSFCGANFLMGNLALRGQRARAFFGEPSSADFTARLKTAVRLLQAAKQAADARIGLFGEGIVPKFFDIDISPADREKLRRRWNIRFVGVPTAELVARAKSYKEDAMEKEAVTFARRFSKIAVPGEALVTQARLLKALRDISRKEGFDSIAVRCWPELQKDYGAWPCPALGLLNDDGLPAACEGDPGGALDMLLAAQLAKKPSTLLDIVDWDDRRNRFSIWHCGPTAPSWAAARKTCLIPHNVDGATKAGQPAFGLPGIVDMEFAPGPVTIFRTLGALDDEFAVQGKLAPAGARRICGSFGEVAEATMYGRKADTLALRAQIFDRCLPHHYTAARGRLFS